MSLASRSSLSSEARDGNATATHKPVPTFRLPQTDDVRARKLKFSTDRVLLPIICALYEGIAGASLELETKWLEGPRSCMSRAVLSNSACWDLGLKIRDSGSQIFGSERYEFGSGSHSQAPEPERSRSLSTSMGVCPVWQNLGMILRILRLL